MEDGRGMGKREDGGRRVTARILPGATRWARVPFAYGDVLVGQGVGEPFSAGLPGLNLRTRKVIRVTMFSVLARLEHN